MDDHSREQTLQFVPRFGAFWALFEVPLDFCVDILVGALCCGHASFLNRAAASSRMFRRKADRLQVVGGRLKFLLEVS